MGYNRLVKKDTSSHSQLKNRPIGMILEVIPTLSNTVIHLTYLLSTQNRNILVIKNLF